MVRKLARDSLTSKLAAARAMATEARANDDDLGAMQFAYLINEVQADVERVGAAPENLASVALFFGGAAVLGSIGVKAEFAGKAIEDFQDLVAKSHATAELGEIARMGRVPRKSSSELMVTDVVKGSFGFVLEEAAEYEPTAQTSLVETVEHVTVLVDQLASQDEERFEEAIQNLDARVLGAARDFFKTLENADASVRIVEGEKDVSIGRADVRRAFARTSTLEVEEREDEIMDGRLYVLPVGKRFEFRLYPAGVTISGGVSSAVASALETDNQLFDNPVGKYWRAQFKVREVRRRNLPVKFYYTLTGLLQEIHVVEEPRQDT